MARVTITVESRHQGNVTVAAGGDNFGPDTPHDIAAALDRATALARGAYGIRCGTGEPDA